MLTNIIAIDYWDDPLLKADFLQKISSDEKFEKIIIYSQNEWEVESVFGEKELWNYFITTVENKNIYVDLVTSLTSKNLNFNPEKYKNINVQYWGEYWLIKTYSVISASQFVNKISKKKEGVIDFKYHFVSLNRRPHKHRCYLIDQLAKEDLIRDNAITWCHEGRGVNYPPDFQFQHFIPTKLRFNEGVPSDEIDQYDPPVEYFESFAQLVSESDTDIKFMSEKISIPLILGKPFIAHAGQGIHKYLEKLGFELYTEIFDYSFDDEPDSNTRCNLVIENFKRLSHIPLAELSDLEKQLLPKIKRNQLRAKEIALDFDSFPEAVKVSINAWTGREEIVSEKLWDILYNLSEYKLSNSGYI